MKLVSKLPVVLVLSLLTWMLPFPVQGGEGPGGIKGRPRVMAPVKVDVFGPLRSVRTAEPKAALERKVREIPLGRSPGGKGARVSRKLPAQTDSTLQSILGAGGMPEPLVNFDGVNNVDGYLPPDTIGVAGSDHYVQWVNTSFAVYDKSGKLLYGPAAANTLWQGFGGACENTNDGDPIVLYDHLANRWLMSQFALPNFPSGPFYQCIAVSDGANPVDSKWYRYAFSFSKMNDYPKFGVWPDGYYMSINQFASGSLDYAGQGVVAFEREKMLAGQEARMVYFDLFEANSGLFGMLPSHFDGTPPPAGAPNYFVEVEKAGVFSSHDSLGIWEFHVDWDNTQNSTFGVSLEPNAVLDVASYNTLCLDTMKCIPQPGTTAKLDAIADRLMYRVQYRNFGDREALVLNHTVDAGSLRAGIRWYEVRDPGGAPVIHQQGTYAPSDGAHRWMGSLAMDSSGNMALGYSVSSSTIYPSIRYTGRLVDDPPGEMTQGEVELVAGGGSQTYSGGRWGDYSMMALDPTDDCTFWYTQEYYAATSTASWKTRIGSFRYSTCKSVSTGGIEGTLTDADSGKPVKGGVVSTTEAYAASNSEGHYSLVELAAGSYDLSVKAYGYESAAKSGVAVSSGRMTVEDFSLNPLPKVQVCGKVTDASGHGWGVYARVDISAEDIPLDPVTTNPQTGAYCVELFQGLTYTFKVTSISGGYTVSTFTGIPGSTQDFALTVDSDQCAAPGYGLSDTENFELTDGGYTTTGATSWTWGTPQSGPGRAHSGFKAWGATLAGSGGSAENSTLQSPSMDMSSLGGNVFQLSWWQWLSMGSANDSASVEVSKDGGNNWTVVYGPVSGKVDSAWTRHAVALDASYAVSDFRVRFHVVSGNTSTLGGFYVDDVAVGVCAQKQGGLVVGNVLDLNTHYGRNGAVVSSPGGETATTQGTPMDKSVRNGYYELFVNSSVPSQTTALTAAALGGYGSDTHQVEVITDSVVKQDFDLPAGLLSYDSSQLAVSLWLGEKKTTALTLKNSGTKEASFSLVEVTGSAQASGPFNTPRYLVKPFKQQFKDARSLKLEPLPTAPAYPGAGEIVEQWTAEVPAPFGMIYDVHQGRIWVGSSSPTWGGLNALFEFKPEGGLTGRSRPFAWQPAYGPGDGTYDVLRHTLWVVNIDSTAGTDCIYEIDPDRGYTGRRICPKGGLPGSQRGLAHDPGTDSFFVGSWNDSMVHHFASNGVLRESVDVGLPVAGLAYNPATGHLFAMTNAAPSLIYVLDVRQGYKILGAFAIPGFSDYGGAGLEIDPDGTLWAVDQQMGRVFGVRSGETASLKASDVAWLSEEPAAGTLASGASRLISVTFDTSGTAITKPGTYVCRLKTLEDTPYSLSDVQVTLKVSAHHIKATAGAGGTVSPSGSVVARHGGSKTFTIKPKAGYGIMQVLVDGKSVGKVSSYTFKDIVSYHTIHATFEQRIQPTAGSPM